MYVHRGDAGVLEPVGELAAVLLGAAHHVEINSVVVVHPLVELTVVIPVQIGVGLLRQASGVGQLSHHRAVSGVLRLRRQVGHGGPGIVRAGHPGRGQAEGRRQALTGRPGGRQTGGEGRQERGVDLLRGLRVVRPLVDGRLADVSEQLPVGVGAVLELCGELLVLPGHGPRVAVDDRLGPSLGVVARSARQRRQSGVVGADHGDEPAEVLAIVARQGGGSRLGPRRRFRPGAVLRSARHLLQLRHGVAQSQRDIVLRRRGETLLTEAREMLDSLLGGPGGTLISGILALHPLGRDPRDRSGQAVEADIRIPGAGFKELPPVGDGGIGLPVALRIR